MIKEIIEELNEKRGGVVNVILNDENCRADVSAELENIFDDNDVDYEFVKQNDKTLLAINVSELSPELKKELISYIEKDDCINTISFE